MSKLLKQTLITFSIMCLSVGFTFSAFAEDVPLPLTVIETEWNSGDQKLIVKGEGPIGNEVVVRDVNSRIILGTTNIANEEWELNLQNPSPIPCNVLATASNGESVEQSVTNAPSNCGTLANLPPNGMTTPMGVVTITAGESVNFSGMGADPDGHLPLAFYWDFGGGAPNSGERSPGDVVFSNPGTFFIAFFVIDSLGLADPTPEIMVVVVEPNQSGLPSVPQQPFIMSGNHQVLPANDLGMHCGDLGNAVFSLLPPFNRVLAQVIQKGSTGPNRPRILDWTQTSVEYSAASNPLDPIAYNSINSTSQNSETVYKTDFWDTHPITGNPIVMDLFGLNPSPDEGLAFGQKMPGHMNPYITNNPQFFNRYEFNLNAFVAPGIPLTPTDDRGRHNSYPLMRIQARDTTGQVIATTDTVVPVSEEVNCAGCHALEGENPMATERQGIVYAQADSQSKFDVEHAGKINILRLHDSKHGTALEGEQPVLCARCHYSAALDLTEQGPQGAQVGRGAMSEVVHKLHGGPHPLRPNEISEIIPSQGPMETNCFQCHPGKVTQCFRGAMFKAGLQCQDCHSGMFAVAGINRLTTGNFRRHWLDEPKCQSCHTGDALNHQGNDLVLRKAFDPADPAATPILATNERFAENKNTLYRNSKGHGGVFCAGCHGSPHAIWPNQDPRANDNVAATQLQGHSGQIIECTTCHTAGSLGLTLDGPHGMHPVNDFTWNKKHKELYEKNKQQCKTCHGQSLEGTILSKTAADRTLLSKEEQPNGSKSIFVAKGSKVSCTLCHKLPE